MRIPCTRISASFDCINTPKGLIDKAVKLGLSGIAITDHECLSALPEANAYGLELRKEYPDFKVALGDEVYLTDTRDKGIYYYHCILIAKDSVGFKMLRETSSKAWLNSYFDRGMERVPTLRSELENVIKKYGKGHLIMSSACLASRLSRLILKLIEEEKKPNNHDNIIAVKRQIDEFMKWCIEWFGDDFYCEVAPGKSPEQVAVNKRCAQIARAYGQKVVIGTDAHYLNKEDRYVHKAFLTSKQAERETDSFYQYSYLQSEEELKENLAPSELDYNELVRNSEDMYNKIEIYDIAHPQQIPKVEIPDYPKRQERLDGAHPILSSLFSSDNKSERYWINECFKGFKEKKIDPMAHTEYLDELEKEADIKRTVGHRLDTCIFDYPITLKHYIDMIWENGSTIGAGRGSAGAGLNHWLLGITQYDPVKLHLPFERYMNKDTKGLPDVDFDLAPSKRAQIIQKVKEERGQNFASYIDDDAKKELGCTLVATFGTASTKNAIKISCRGYRSEEYPDGIDVDEAEYLSSLIPQERGFVWPLKDVLYGNKSKGRDSVQPFVDEIENYPGLKEIALGIEGLVVSRGSHASGVIFFDEDPYEYACFMKTPSGDVITQYDLEWDEYCGLTKYDWLMTSVQDKIITTIDLLQRNDLLPSDLTLREVYNKYLSPEVMNFEDPEIWDAIDKGNILDMFQFDSMVGSQGIQQVQPRSLDDLSNTNGIIRLMAQPGQERPLDKFVRYKNDISLWYKEMSKAGLTDAEQRIMERHMLSSHGLAISQECIMWTLMDKDICGFNLADANAARKVISKKKMDKLPALHKQILATAKSPDLGKYVWDYVVSPSAGYGFSDIHSCFYSMIGFQTAYLATHFNPIYWDTACLIVNSGAIDGGSTDYGKSATAIGEIRSANIKVSLVDINESGLTFTPDARNNQILYGLKGILNVGEDVIKATLENRPYVSIKDYYNKVHPNKQAMVSLIKSGAFDKMENRKFAMAWFIWESCDKKKRITLQNIPGLIKYHLLPEDTEDEVTARRVYEFTRYLRKVCLSTDKTYYDLTDRALQFLAEMNYDSLIVDGNKMTVKDWDKIYEKWKGVLRQWINENKDEILDRLNTEIFMQDWNKYAQGTISAWEMESICFYFHDHELKNVNTKKYGYDDFFQLPEEPEVEDSWTNRDGRTFHHYKLHKICGTCINKNKSKATVSLLTTTGVVTIKFRKEYFALFDKQISQRQPDGTKKRIEASWFNRGSMIVVMGIRRGDTFMPKKYANTIGHELYHIVKAYPNGELDLTATRAQGEYDEED